MPTRPTRLLLSALALTTVVACGTETDPAAAPTAAGAEDDADSTTDDAGNCTTNIEITTPDGATSTLTSANIQTVYGGDVVTVFAADFPIEDHDVPGRPPTFPTDDGQMVWIDVGASGIDSDAPQLGTGDSVTLPGSERTAVTASLITVDRIDPLFGDQSGSIDLQQLSDDGACIAIDVTIAEAQVRGTAAGPVLRGE